MGGYPKEPRNGDQGRFTPLQQARGSSRATPPSGLACAASRQRILDAVFERWKAKPDRHLWSRSGHRPPTVHPVRPEDSRSRTPHPSRFDVEGTP